MSPWGVILALLFHGPRILEEREEEEKRRRQARGLPVPNATDVARGCLLAELAFLGKTVLLLVVSLGVPILMYATGRFYDEMWWVPLVPGAIGIIGLGVLWSKN